MDKKEKISRKIRSMKKYVDFRNILVHMYEEVDVNNCFYRSYGGKLEDYERRV